MSDIGIGDKVVCIDVIGFDRSPAPHKPKLDETYKVRSAFEYHGFVYLRFNEIINPDQPDHRHGGFWIEEAFGISYFRKVIETDISIFRRIAAKPKEPLLV